MKLIARNGRELKVGSCINYLGEKCHIYFIKFPRNIGLERLSDGISWCLVDPKYFGAKFK